MTAGIGLTRSTGEAGNHRERFPVVRSQEKQKVRERAACLPPNKRRCRRKRLVTAGDIAMPVRI